MIKTAVLVVVTIGVVYFGLELVSNVFDIPRSEVFSWTGILLLVFLLERFLKYLLQLPFKRYFSEVRKHILAKAVQDTGFSLSYICVWLAVGYNPIQGVVKGEEWKLHFSNPIFLKIALVLILGTVFFSFLWWLTVRLKK